MIPDAHNGAVEPGQRGPVRKRTQSTLLRARSRLLRGAVLDQAAHRRPASRVFATKASEAVVPCRRFGADHRVAEPTVRQSCSNSEFRVSYLRSRAGVVRARADKKGNREMVDRPYHDYATSALRELSRDLASSQAQLDDQRADYVEPAGSDHDDLRELDALINDLGHELAAVDRELATRHRERTTAIASTRRGGTWDPGGVRGRGHRVTRAVPKPHCRAKRTPVRELG